MPLHDGLQTYSLKKIGENGGKILRVLGAVFEYIESGAAVIKYLNENALPVTPRTFIFGLGKAALAMTSAAIDKTSFKNALVITKHSFPFNDESVTVMEGNHPIPGEESLRAGAAAINFVSQLSSADLLLCLISGGGSSLMTAPYISLENLQNLTANLLASGARIDEMNILRRHLDRIKGGGLLHYANGARVVSLLLSDVVDDALEAIASGPTTPDPTSKTDALRILEKYNLTNKIPLSIIQSLQETVKPNDPLLHKVQNVIVASNEIALSGAKTRAEYEGFQTKIIHRGMQGEARQVGFELASVFKQSLKEMQRPFCLLAGGETTVTLSGEGKGGRNQELALSSVEVLAGLENIILISLATDGEDGPTDAAGAVVTGESAQRAKSLGMNAADYLSRNDAYTFFDSLNDLIKIGPSGTNVNDLVFCFAF